MKNFDFRKVGTGYAITHASKFNSYQEKIMSASTLHLQAHSFSALEWTPLRHAAREVAQQVRAIALFAIAPFIGLVYAALMPFVGLAMLAVLACKALLRSSAALTALRASGRIALFIAAPFIGLAYAVALPFVGTAMLARVAYQAARA
ncbi:MAG: hypothetical protein ACR2I0_10895 [Rhodoferax sp.]